jgi:hypothetical protein
MAWGKAGSTTLGSAGNTIDISSLSDNKFNMVLADTIQSGSGTVYGGLRLNGDSGNNYSIRSSINGGTDGTGINQNKMSNGEGTDAVGESEFSVHYIMNISSEEKLAIFDFTSNIAGTGAGSASGRRKLVAKWANTSNAVDQITLPNIGTASFDSNSNVSVLGSDAVSSWTLQDGAVFEETDTNKHYLLDDGTWTEI